MRASYWRMRSEYVGPVRKSVLSGMRVVSCIYLAHVTLIKESWMRASYRRICSEYVGPV